MWGAREEVVGDGLGDFIMVEEGFYVAGLGDGVAGEVDDSFWFDVGELGDKFPICAGARWVEDDGLVGLDKIE